MEKFMNYQGKYLRPAKIMALTVLLIEVLVFGQAIAELIQH